jgi:hypothetical protein
MTKTIQTGIAISFAGLLVLLCWTSWFETRSWCPVDIPISLAQGTHFTTGKFYSNLNAQYTIEIDAKGKIPLDRLSCLLGNGIKSTCPVAPVVRLDWVLSQGGILTRGKSDDFLGSGSTAEFYGEAYRTIGYFKSQKGQHYKLDFDVLADGSSLSQATPHLKVSVADPSFESGLVIGGLLRVICVFLILLGAALAVGSLVRQNRAGQRRSDPGVRRTG